MTLTDEEIRVKVAELMGWKRIHYKTAKADSWTRPGEEPDYPTDEITGKIPQPRDESDESPLDRLGIPKWPDCPAAALQLCDRMHSEGWTVEQIRRPGEDWIVSLFKGVIAGPSTTDPSLARAVTLCFLKCHE